jgi:hypothetical protein
VHSWPRKKERERKLKKISFVPGVKIRNLNPGQPIAPNAVILQIIPSLNAVIIAVKNKENAKGAKDPLLPEPAPRVFDF